MLWRLALFALLAVLALVTFCVAMTRQGEDGGVWRWMFFASFAIGATVVLAKLIHP